MATMQFTGKYAAIRKDFYKATQKKYTPSEGLFVNGRYVTYKTEAGFKAALSRVFANKMAYLDKIEDAGTVTNATMTVWYPARSYQARATIKYTYVKNGQKGYGSVSGGPTTGYGYDKMSTALAEALEKSPEFMKILMDARAKKKKLPYGVSLNIGKPYMPGWDGGVGTGCFMSVLKECGYDVKYIYTGIKDSETYEITFKRKVR